MLDPFLSFCSQSHIYVKIYLPPSIYLCMTVQNPVIPTIWVRIMWFQYLTTNYYFQSFLSLFKSDQSHQHDTWYHFSRTLSTIVLHAFKPPENIFEGGINESRLLSPSASCLLISSKFPFGVLKWTLFYYSRTHVNICQLALTMPWIVNSKEICQCW